MLAKETVLGNRLKVEGRGGGDRGPKVFLMLVGLTVLL